MPDYLPLSAFRQGLLPAACLSCAWWQTTGNAPIAPQVAAAKRRRWMASLEDTWGITGVLLEGSASAEHPSSPGTQNGSQTPDASAPVIVASISFAPAAAVPRLRELPFGSLPDGSVLLFCLKVHEGQAPSQGKRVLHKALAQLKARGVQEVYALADPNGGAESQGSEDEHPCRVFSAGFLSANGFDQIAEDCGLVLMRVDLRGLLSLLSEVRAKARRVLRQEPTPSPAAWIHRESS